MRWGAAAGLIPEMENVLLFEPRDEDFLFGFDPLKLDGLSRSLREDALAAMVRAIGQLWGHVYFTNTPTLNRGLPLIVYTLWAKGLTPREGCLRASSKPVYLLDTNVVSELRRPHPHPAVVRWIEQVAADELLLSAVTVGEIQAGIEFTREQDMAKAEELEAWLSAVLVSYSVLPMNADTFRAWARLKRRRSDTLLEDAMIAATALVHIG